MLAQLRPPRCLALWLALLPYAYANAQRPPMQVAVAPVVERDVPASIRLVGTVRADRTAIVASEVEGLVADFPTDEGDRLEQGAVICTLDTDAAKFRLAEARGRLNSLRARLQELERGTREELVRQRKAAVEEAQAILDKWEFERKRIAALFDRNQSSAKEKHDAEMEYLAAQQRLSASRAAFEIAENGPRKEEIARARYDVAAQEAVVKRLERDIAKATIRAPFTGYIVAKRTEVGEWLDAGGPVVEMVATERVRVRADAPESTIRFARPGQSATIYFDALQNTRSAPITRVIPRAAGSARTFPIEIDLQNDDQLILPGMFAWVHVPAGPRKPRTMAPIDAVVPRGTDKTIYVIRPGREDASTAFPITVNTGLQIGSEIEIRGGALQPGDQVVVRGNERIYGPTPVVPVPLEKFRTKPGAAATQNNDAPKP